MFAWLPTASLLVVGGVWGSLARLGLTALNMYDGQSIAPIVWAQAVGCVVMGFASQPRTRAALEEWYAPAYTMITTGFAGSCTTFSSWVLQSFLAVDNASAFDRHGLHSVMDMLTQTFATLGLALAGYWGGRALGEAVPTEWVLSRWRPRRGAADAAALAVGALTWVGAALLCALYAPFRHVTWSLVWAPIGVWARWQLARLHTPPKPDTRVPLRHWRHWPVGTFLANILATMLLCAVFSAQRYSHLSQLSCGVLQGLGDGTAACLSTVSTLVAELTALRPMRSAVAYVVSSYLVAMALCVLLVGAPIWTLGAPTAGTCT